MAYARDVLGKLTLDSLRAILIINNFGFIAILESWAAEEGEGPLQRSTIKDQEERHHQRLSPRCV